MTNCIHLDLKLKIRTRQKQICGLLIINLNSEKKVIKVINYEHCHLYTNVEEGT